MARGDGSGSERRRMCHSIQEKGRGLAGARGKDIGKKSKRMKERKKDDGRDIDIRVVYHWVDEQG